MPQAIPSKSKPTPLGPTSTPISNNPDINKYLTNSPIIQWSRQTLKRQDTLDLIDLIDGYSLNNYLMKLVNTSLSPIAFQTTSPGSKNDRALLASNLKIFWANLKRYFSAKNILVACAPINTINLVLFAIENSNEVNPNPKDNKLRLRKNSANSINSINSSPEQSPRGSTSASEQQIQILPQLPRSHLHLISSIAEEDENAASSSEREPSVNLDMSRARSSNSVETPTTTACTTRSNSQNSLSTSPLNSSSALQANQAQLEDNQNQIQIPNISQNSSKSLYSNNLTTTISSNLDQNILKNLEQIETNLSLLLLASIETEVEEAKQFSVATMMKLASESAQQTLAEIITTKKQKTASALNSTRPTYTTLLYDYSWINNEEILVHETSAQLFARLKSTMDVMRLLDWQKDEEYNKVYSFFIQRLESNSLENSVD